MAKRKILESKSNCFLLAVISEKLGGNDSSVLAQRETAALGSLPETETAL